LRWLLILAAAALGATLVFVAVSETPREGAVLTVGVAPHMPVSTLPQAGELQLPPSAAAGAISSGSAPQLAPSTASRSPSPAFAGEDPQAGGETPSGPTVSAPLAAQPGGETRARVPSSAATGSAAQGGDLQVPPSPASRALPPQAGGDPRAGREGEAPPDLIAKRLSIPVEGIAPEQLAPAFFDARGERGHEAIDIMAPEGRPVLAAEDGKIAKLFASAQGGLTIYQFDPTESYAYYYAHLDAYAPGLTEGAMVTRGQVIGTVGSSGNASAAGPHLHFAIFRLGPEKNWWKGEPVDPYPALMGK
jgi:murein DD-endopeptidase MepM/ murein hydrolase activator NlpD